MVFVCAFFGSNHTQQIAAYYLLFILSFFLHTVKVCVCVCVGEWVRERERGCVDRNTYQSTWLNCLTINAKAKPTKM